jgi:ribosome-binding factor A
MSQPFRKDRLASEIVKETSQVLLYEMRDPRLGFVTVTRAKVSDDYQNAKVFVSVLGTPKQKKLTMAALKHARGFVQAELSRRIRMRVFPEILFELDESIEKAFKMTQMLNDLARQRQSAAPATAPAPAPAENQGEEE